MPQKNPYVVLGVPFGSDRATCSAAFARRAKKLRRNPTSTITITDLTWALNQVDEAIRDPDTALHLYRVPADPDLFDVPETEGLLRPPPEPLARRTQPLDAAAREALLAEVAASAAMAAVESYCLVRPLPTY
jgi:hypothetical protein